MNRLRPLSSRGKSGRLEVKMMRCKINFGSLLGRPNNILNNAPGRHGRHLPATLGIKLRGTGGKGPGVRLRSKVVFYPLSETPLGHWIVMAESLPNYPCFGCGNIVSSHHRQNMFPPFLYWIHIGRCQTKSRCCQVTNFREGKLLIVGLALFEYFPELKR